MWGQRRRWLANIRPTLVQRLVCVRMILTRTVAIMMLSWRWLNAGSWTLTTLRYFNHGERRVFSILNNFKVLVNYFYFILDVTIWRLKSVPALKESIQFFVLENSPDLELMNWLPLFLWYFIEVLSCTPDMYIFLLINIWHVNITNNSFCHSLRLKTCL